jgi:hypothetical protein
VKRDRKNADNCRHSKDGAFDTVFDGSNYFANCITLNPRRTMQAWEKLSVDTWMLEVASYPALLREALIATLKEHDIGKKRQAEQERDSSDR